jgi:hypothetical protein
MENLRRVLGWLITAVTGLLGCGVLAAFGLFSLLVLVMFLDPANPAFQLFLQTYQVENRSGRSLLVSPLHNYRQDASYYPPYRVREPGVGRFREIPPGFRIPLETNAIASISYDGDAGVPVFLLIRTDPGTETRILDLCAGSSRAWTGTGRRCRIPPFESLARAPVALLPVFDGATVNWLPPASGAALIASAAAP